ncbi:hypothetical protein FHX37_2649 [Haloactinospora alba]|uniref:Uncharacterized protein n=1 Tax=Haloactinospora alba TaxID=405555 RepID=A0A543NLI2_9ACTN|nr:hypothetical protein [Haloactinospora alba]TQN32672.1 hypothetical protein FHX37_2649 [Haloactinospora alba]
MPRHGVRGIASTLLVLTVAGCSPDSGTRNPSPSPTSHSPAESSSSPSDEERVLNAYTGMWEVIVTQSHTTDPDYSALEPYATDQALEFAQESLEERVQENAVARGDTSHSADVVEIETEQGTAEVQDCVDSTEWLREDADTGELVEEKPEDPIHRRAEATVEFDGLSWRVSELLLGQVGSC